MQGNRTFAVNENTAAQTAGLPPASCIHLDAARIIGA